jgi:hypothetical protein
MNYRLFIYELFIKNFTTHTKHLECTDVANLFAGIMDINGEMNCVIINLIVISIITLKYYIELSF